MRTHVRDRRGLSCRLGGRGGCTGAHLTCGAALGEPAADLVCDVKLASSEGPGSRDGIARAGIAWSFRLEQPEHSLRAVRRPYSNDSSFGFTQGLR
jgi:hypothetical protein